MIVDMHLRFTGFWGTAGHCHIRFCKASYSKPLVIVCSQYKGYQGTSVTNALEIISSRVFYDIFNKKIDDISFDFEMPSYEVWDADANIFDKFLTFVFSRKYQHRFKATKLKVNQIFSQIVWLEHYPENWCGTADEERYHLVQMDERGSPDWSRPSEQWLVEHTGWTKEELLIHGDKLWLNKDQRSGGALNQLTDVIGKKTGLKLVQWTEDLVAEIPSLLSAHRSLLGQSAGVDVPEESVQTLISRLLVTRLPSADFFQPNFNISKKLGINGLGREKNVDFAIFAPDGSTIDSVLEVKRTSTKSASSLTAGVLQDLARLLLVSQNLDCTSYLLVCGDINAIRASMSDRYFSLDDDPPEIDRFFPTNSLKLSREYKELLQTFRINNGATRLQGLQIDGPRSVVLWQVSHSGGRLSDNRPYRYNIHSE